MIDNNNEQSMTIKDKKVMITEDVQMMKFVQRDESATKFEKKL